MTMTNLCPMHNPRYLIFRENILVMIGGLSINLTRGDYNKDVDIAGV